MKLTSAQLERFLAHVSPEPNSGCWLWTGSVHEKGYGRCTVKGSPTIVAHRISYQEFVGDIPDGYQIDHLCKVTSCVNPSHLEAVLPYENNLRSNSFSAKNIRKTHCLRGHELSGDNLVASKNGWRICKTCHRIKCFNRRRLKAVGNV